MHRCALLVLKPYAYNQISWAPGIQDFFEKPIECPVWWWHRKLLRPRFGYFYCWNLSLTIQGGRNKVASVLFLYLLVTMFPELKALEILDFAASCWWSVGDLLDSWSIHPPTGVSHGGWESTKPVKETPSLLDSQRQRQLSLVWTIEFWQTWCTKIQAQNRNPRGDVSRAQKPLKHTAWAQAEKI